jgi:hypothetical protein
MQNRITNHWLNVNRWWGIGVQRSEFLSGARHARFRDAARGPGWPETGFYLKTLSSKNPRLEKIPSNRTPRLQISKFIKPRRQKRSFR